MFFLISTKPITSPKNPKKKDYQEKGIRFSIKLTLFGHKLISKNGIIRINKKSKVRLFSRNTSSKCFNRYDFRNIILNISKPKPARTFGHFAG